MKYTNHFISVIAWPLFALSVICCSNQKKIGAETNKATATTQNNDKLVFTCGGPSVAPQYYRSYMISVTAGQVYYAISDYSQVLSKDSMALTKAAYESFTTAIDGLHLKNQVAVTGGGCTGGHLERLDLYPGSSKEVKGQTYFCGGQKYSDLEGDVVTAAKLFNALVPDLDKKIDATRKN
jgi:hypothetical protein